jgi:hypothetical protein
MNYRVRVSEHDYWDVVTELIEPHVSDLELRCNIEQRALEIQRARQLPLPAIVLIEKQD